MPKRVSIFNISHNPKKRRSDPSKVDLSKYQVREIMIAPTQIAFSDEDAHLEDTIVQLNDQIMAAKQGCEKAKADYVSIANSTMDHLYKVIQQFISSKKGKRTSDGQCELMGLGPNHTIDQWKQKNRAAYDAIEAVRSELRLKGYDLIYKGVSRCDRDSGCDIDLDYGHSNCGDEMTIVITD
jgi:hypothetical protein